MKERIWVCKTLEQGRKVASELSQILPREGCIVLLKGPVGIGKTTLIRMLAEQCGSDEVMSPTFALHNQVHLADRKLEHFDLYRVENEDELETSGVWEIISAPGHDWIVIEWPERMNLRYLPHSKPIVTLHLDWLDSARRITLKSLAEL